MGVPEISTAAPEAKVSDGRAAVIKVQNEDELRLAQMGEFRNPLFVLELELQLRMNRPQARIEAPFFRLELDWVGCELHNFLDRYDMI